MANHVNKVFIVREKKSGDWITGDAFWPEQTDKILKATRSANLKDAKTYVKTASKRMKIKTEDLEIVPADEVRDDKFVLIEIKPKED